VYLRDLGISRARAPHLIHLTRGDPPFALHASLPLVAPPGTAGRELTFTHAHAREDNCCGVTRREVAHNPLPRSPLASSRSLATSMCNNPYRHGWLPLLGLHNRALIDNLYGACRLFDYPPPAGRLGSPARRDDSSFSFCSSLLLSCRRRFSGKYSRSAFAFLPSPPDD